MRGPIDYVQAIAAITIDSATDLKTSLDRMKPNHSMDIATQVLRIVDEVLSLNGRSAGFTRNTLLLGAIPELDSMAVISLLSAFEDRLGLLIDDDDIDGATFANVGSLTDFVTARLMPLPTQ